MQRMFINNVEKIASNDVFTLFSWYRGTKTNIELPPTKWILWKQRWIHIRFIMNIISFDTIGANLTMFLPKKGTCDKFFYCVDGMFNMIQCPGGLVFNPKTGTDGSAIREIQNTIFCSKICSIYSIFVHFDRHLYVAGWSTEERLLIWRYASIIFEKPRRTEFKIISTNWIWLIERIEGALLCPETINNYNEE